MGRSTTSPDRRRSALAQLEDEEARTLAALHEAVVAAGEELCALDELRDWVREHPNLAVGAGTALGVLLAPYAAGAARRALPFVLAHWSGAAALGSPARS